MRLEKIRILRAPGLRHELRLEALAPGLNLVVGPNASGKSTLCRAVRATLWPDSNQGQGLEAVTIWRGPAGAELEARLEGGRVEWLPKQSGAGHTTWGLPGAELSHAYGLSMRELIGWSRDADAPIASQIARELSGGYDLPALKAGFEPRVKPHQTKRSAYEKAKNELARIERAQDELEGHETRLIELDAELQQIDLVRGETEALEQARRLASERSSMSKLEAELSSLPSALAHLDGSELGHFDQESKRFEEARQRVRELDRKRQELEHRRSGAGLPDGALDPSLLDPWRDRVSKLETAEEEARRAQTALEAARARAQRSAEALRGQGSSDTVAPDETTLAKLERVIAEARALESTVAAIEHQRARVGSESSETSSPSLSTLADGLRFLRQWIASPDAPKVEPAASPKSGRAVVLGLLGIVLIASGLYAGLIPLLIVGGMLAGAALGLYLGRAPRTATPAPVTNERASFQAAFLRTGLAPPSAWQPAEVSARLAALESEHEALAEQRRVASQRQTERGRLDAELREKTEALEAHRAMREQAAKALGLDPSLFDLDLLALSKHLSHHAEANAAVASLEAGLGEQLRLIEEARAALSAFLIEHREPAAADAAEAKARLQSLRARSDQVREAEGELTRIRHERSMAEENRQEAETRMNALLAKTGASEPNRSHLEVLSLGLPRYRELTRDFEICRRQLEALESQLEDHPELMQLSLDALDAQLEAAKARLARRDELLVKRTELRKELEEAGKRTALADALAQAKHTEIELLDDLQSVLEGVAGRVLLGHIEALYEARYEPEILSRARAWFSRFTHQSFELELSRRDRNRLAAIDTVSGERRELEQLSDGTRVQLLLAARMAYLSLAEGESRLPFFLDEALSTTDGPRFEAIAESLFEVAAEGRQIFYLSSNTSDVEAWLRIAEARGQLTPSVFEFGEPTRSGRPATLGLKPTEPPVVPAPGDLSPEAYAQLLEVPVIDPERPVSSWHLYYLASEHLDLLHAALEHGVHSAGQWRAFRRSALFSKERFEEEAVRAVDARLAVAESTHRWVRVGRGRRVTVEALEASGAISETFMAEAREQLKREGGDPVRVVAAIGSISKFRTAKRDELRDYLIEQGFLDESPRLELAEIVLRVTEALRGLITEGILAPEALPSLIGWYAEKSGLANDRPVSYSA